MPTSIDHLFNVQRSCFFTRRHMPGDSALGLSQGHIDLDRDCPQLRCLGKICVRRLCEPLLFRGPKLFNVNGCWCCFTCLFVAVKVIVSKLVGTRLATGPVAFCMWTAQQMRNTSLEGHVGLPLSPSLLTDLCQDQATWQHLLPFFCAKSIKKPFRTSARVANNP